MTDDELQRKVLIFLEDAYPHERSVKEIGFLTGIKDVQEPLDKLYKQGKIGINRKMGKHVFYKVIK